MFGERSHKLHASWAAHSTFNAQQQQLHATRALRVLRVCSNVGCVCRRYQSLVLLVFVVLFEQVLLGRDLLYCQAFLAWVRRAGVLVIRMVKPSALLLLPLLVLRSRRLTVELASVGWL